MFRAALTSGGAGSVSTSASISPRPGAQQELEVLKGLPPWRASDLGIPMVLAAARRAALQRNSSPISPERSQCREGAYGAPLVRLRRGLDLPRWSPTSKKTLTRSSCWPRLSQISNCRRRFALMPTHLFIYRSGDHQLMPTLLWSLTRSKMALTPRTLQRSTSGPRASTGGTCAAFPFS